MITALPRPLFYVGIPTVLALVGGALWAWASFGLGVWFDTASSGLALCL